jgi:cell division protein FtsW
MNIYNARQRLRLDVQYLFGLLALLVTIGIVFVYSASSVFALENYGSAAYFMKKQLFCLVLGIVCMLGIATIPLTKIKQLVPWAFLGALLLTVLTLVPKFAPKIHGSSRWLFLGGFGFQPSELLKWTLLLFIAALLEKHWYQKGAFLKTLLPISLITGVSGLVLLRQPDFGLTVTLCTTIFIMLFIAKFKLRYLMGLLLLGLPAIVYLIMTKAYRLKRVLTFLNPWEDPKGAGFQVIQSLIAIGSGGSFGVGISNSKQKFFYLPMQHTDFIFSIIAEETGFIGAMALITLYLGFAYLGIRIALMLKDHFAIFATFGFIIFNTLQALINLCVSAGLFPTKGIGLPFVSYGGAAIIANCLMAGVIISCVRDYR